MDHRRRLGAIREELSRLTDAEPTRISWNHFKFRKHQELPRCSNQVIAELVAQAGLVAMKMQGVEKGDPLRFWCQTILKSTPDLVHQAHAVATSTAEDPWGEGVQFTCPDLVRSSLETIDLVLKTSSDIPAEETARTDWEVQTRELAAKVPPADLQHSSANSSSHGSQPVQERLPTWPAFPFRPTVTAMGSFNARSLPRSIFVHTYEATPSDVAAVQQLGLDPRNPDWDRLKAVVLSKGVPITALEALNIPAVLGLLCPPTRSDDVPPTEVALPSARSVSDTKVKLAKWSDLAIGIDESCKIWAHTPPPVLGALVSKRQWAKISLTGGRWKQLLTLAASHGDGRSVSTADLMRAWSLLPSTSSVPTDSRAMPGELERAQTCDQGLSLNAGQLLSKFRDTLDDLRRQLRKQVEGPRETPPNVLVLDKEVVRLGFLVRYLMPQDDGRHRFGASLA